ncbi:MAG: glycosyltransferase [bacterium]
MNQVALIHYSCPPVIGGVEFVIQGQARVMASHGHQVKLIVGTGGRLPEAVVEIIPEIGSRHGHVAEINEALLGGEIPDGFYPLKATIAAKVKAALKGVKVCLIHNVMTMPFNLGLTAALSDIIDELGGHIRFYLWCHDAALIDPNYEIPRPKEYPWHLLGRAHPGAQYVMISKLRRRQICTLLGIPEQDALVVPNGLDMKALLGISDRLWQLALEKGFLEDDLVMLFPSRILRRKNYELGIQIVRALKDQGKKAKLLITAPPDPHAHETVRYFKELHDLCQDLDVQSDVLFLYDLRHPYFPEGKVSFGDLRNLYALCDLLLVTSREEGFGLPLLEAGAFKLPIACANIEPLGEVAGAHALYFDLNEQPTRIAEKIWQLYSSFPTSAMFKRVIFNFSWEAIYRDYLKNIVR